MICLSVIYYCVRDNEKLLECFTWPLSRLVSHAFRRLFYYDPDPDDALLRISTTKQIDRSGWIERCKELKFFSRLVHLRKILLVPAPYWFPRK
jgi:hypothetical protein